MVANDNLSTQEAEEGGLTAPGYIVSATPPWGCIEGDAVFQVEKKK